MRPDTSEPRLKIERSIDASTGTVQHHYFWDGKAAKKVEVKGPLIERIEGLALIVKDLESARRWALRAKQLSAPYRSVDATGYAFNEDRETFNDVKAFFVAALAFYGKCFTEAEGRRTQASRDWLEQEFRAVHDDVMTYRHAFAAHSGKEKLEYAKTYVLLRGDGTDFVPMLHTARIQPDVAIAADGEKGLIELIEHLIEKSVHRYNDATQKVIHELIVPRGLTAWNAAAESSETVVLGTAKGAQ